MIVYLKVKDVPDKTTFTLIFLKAWCNITKKIALLLK